MIFHFHPSRQLGMHHALSASLQATCLQKCSAQVPALPTARLGALHPHSDSVLLPQKCVGWLFFFSFFKTFYLIFAYS